MINFKVFIFFVCTCSCLVINTQSKFLEGWIEPDAWSRSSHFSSQSNDDNESCRACNCEELQVNKEKIVENISMIYYKKLITFLLDRKDFEFDDKKGLYYRTLSITITPTQIDKLEKSIDPRDWDAILGEILPTVQKISLDSLQKPHWFKRLLQGIGSVLKWFLSKFSISELRFELVLILAIIIIIYIKRMHGISLAVIIIFGMFTCGYIYNYYECNRQLEIDQLAEVFDFPTNNPCGEGRYESSIWNLWGIFRAKPSKAECVEYLRKKNKLKLPFCRPDHVLLSYINEIILNQFKMTVEKSTNIFKEINQLIPFPYNIVASIIFCATLVTFLKLFFKYILSPKVWSNHWQGNTNNNQSIPNGPSSSNYHDYDRLSGENLKNFLEICKRQIEPAIHKLENIYTSPSGVQVLKGPTSPGENSVENVKENNGKINKKEIEKSSLVKINSKNDENQNKNCNNFTAEVDIIDLNENHVSDTLEICKASSCSSTDCEENKSKNEKIS